MLSMILTGCNIEFESPNNASGKSDEVVTTTTIQGDQDYPDWSEETHSNDADPNYDTVHPQNEVNRIDIVIAPDQWEAMQTDMTEIYGDF